MENPTPNVSQGQKKQKGKGFSKPVQGTQVKPQPAAVATPQAQGQQAQQCKV